jgi:RHS repeat-associated protein
MERLTKRMNAAQDSARILAYNARGELTNARDEEYWEEWVCPTMELTDCYWEPQTDILANVSYTYDNVGNRTDSGASLQSSSNRYSAFGGYSFTYDLTGNVLSKTKSGYSQTYSWNSLGQLASVTTNGTTVSYGYNGFGVRVRRTEGSLVRRYLYDGPNVVLEVNGTGTKLREYTHFPGVDQPHSMFDGNGAVYYYATDYPGHVAGLFNASGTVANRYRYSAWGLPETTSEGISNSLRYMSREVDSQTGVYYVRNRWYDATVARFISEDPIGLAGGINLYTYAGNSPATLLDPFGLSPDDCVNLVSATDEERKRVDEGMAEWCVVTSYDAIMVIVQSMWRQVFFGWHSLNFGSRSRNATGITWDGAVSRAAVNGTVTGGQGVLGGYISLTMGWDQTCIAAGMGPGAGLGASGTLLAQSHPLPSRGFHRPSFTVTAAGSVPSGRGGGTISGDLALEPGGHLGFGGVQAGWGVGLGKGVSVSLTLLNYCTR